MSLDYPARQAPLGESNELTAGFNITLASTVRVHRMCGHRYFLAGCFGVSGLCIFSHSWPSLVSKKSIQT